MTDWRARVAAVPVARLATVAETGAPHLVPIVFALAGDHLYTAVDAKPKRPGELGRVRNIRADPRVSVLVDVYADDWDRLWWARLDGTARITDDQAPLRLLARKYPRYRLQPPPGPVIDVTIVTWTTWSATR